MEYAGYMTRDEVLHRIEAAFPFTPRPSDDELYVVAADDLLRKIIHSDISGFAGAELPYAGVMALYGEFSTLSRRAVEWLFPSMLRVILQGRDKSDLLHLFLVGYFESMNLADRDSAYNFSWLSAEQIRVVNCLLEFLSEEYGDVIWAAQQRLDELYSRLPKQ